MASPDEKVTMSDTQDLGSNPKHLAPGETIDLAPMEVSELDEAERFLRENNIPPARVQEILADEAALKSLRRRVDWSLMPLLCGTYLLQYIDKQAMGYGAVFDLFTSTGISGSQYSWMASIFYFAYLGFEWPASYLAQKYPTGKIISCFVICWGTVITCTAATSNFAGLAACRFLLGAFEAPITPCFMMVVSMWYKKEEQPARAGLFYCFNGFGSIIGGTLFYGVGQSHGWDVWRIIFIICGGCTIIWGIVLYMFLPDSIFASKKFTTQEKAMLIVRTKNNRTGVLNKKIKPAQVKEALLDPQIWVLFLFVLLNEIINGGIANFGKLIVKGFSGNDALLTTAYGIPYGAWVAVFIFTGPYIASKLKNVRTYVMAIWVLPTMTAACMFWRMDRSGTRNPGLLMAYYIVSLLLIFDLYKC